METQSASKSGRRKSKSKKPTTNPKALKKNKGDGPTCSMFLAEITKKLAYKRKQEEEEEPPINIVHTIIDSITNALPVVINRKSLEKKESPMKIETLQTFAPELLPKDTVDFPISQPSEDIVMLDETAIVKQRFRMPKMPVISSDVLKAIDKRKVPTSMEDVAVNTGGDHNVASEIAKHVNTLKRISLIAEEFNQKTAKNLKEIVDSVQDDLIKKLEEIQEAQKAAKAADKPLENLEEITE